MNGELKVFYLTPFACLRIRIHKGPEYGSNMDPDPQYSLLCLGKHEAVVGAAGVVQHPELEAIHDRYMTCLRHFTEYNFPAHPNRVQDLLVKLPEVSPSAQFLVLFNCCSMVSLSNFCSCGPQVESGISHTETTQG